MCAGYSCFIVGAGVPVTLSDEFVPLVTPTEALPTASVTIVPLSAETLISRYLVLCFTYSKTVRRSDPAVLEICHYIGM